MSKKSTWKYQKGKYKQISLKFSIENDSDMILYHFLRSFDNRSEYIKKLIEADMNWRAWNDEN